MKILLAALAPVLLAFPAFAGDATQPVRDLIKAAEQNWAEGNDVPQDYFSEDRLAHDWSKAIGDLYRKAGAAAAAAANDAEGADFLFDYDVITGGQDGCPLSDISIVAGAAAADGATPVDVKFNNTACMDDADNAPVHLQFKVIEENGQSVVDDLVRLDGETVDKGLKADLAARVKG